MTTLTCAPRRTPRAAAAALCVLTLASAACSTADSDYAGVDIAPQSIVPESVPAQPAHESTGRAGELQYGDSIDDLFFGSRGSTEPAQATLRGFRLLEWEDLIPPGFTGEEVFARYEERLAAAERESPELRSLYDEMDAEFDNAGADPALDGEQIELAGFVAPLTYDGDTITEFLLVPYFGACIHVPPPPTNQTVLVTLADGESLSLEESWGAVRVAGQMSASTTETGLATASYSLTDAQYGVYDT